MKIVHEHSLEDFIERIDNLPSWMDAGVMPMVNLLKDIENSFIGGMVSKRIDLLVYTTEKYTQGRLSFNFLADGLVVKDEKTARSMLSKILEEETAELFDIKLGE